MRNVVHVSVAGAVWWQKTANGWQLLDTSEENNKGPVWVVTDLAEETFSEIKVPRVFGSDRASFIRRQLTNRFPDSVFRIALPPPQAGGLMDRLAPPSQNLTAIDPADRVELALAHIKVPVAGVWSTSMLMARIGQRAAMPAHLFVVLIQPGGMRILFIKHRVPVLTRLITAAQTESEQAAEIIRTLRHLENTHIVERNKDRYSVLLMGGGAGLQTKLTEDRLNILPLPSRWMTDQPDWHWNQVLFDQAVKKPLGQLAPLKYRIAYLAQETSKAAKIAIAVVILSTAAMVGISARGIYEAQTVTHQLQQQLGAITNEISTTDEAIAGFGVTPDMVRKAVALDAEEIEAAPDLQHHLRHLAMVISSVPDARLKTWQWRVLDPAEAACVEVLSATKAPQENEPVPPDSMGQPAQRKVELQMTVVFVEGTGPHQLELKTAAISTQIKAWKGATLLLDPAQGLREGSITIASALEATVARINVWCASVPAKIQVQP